MRLAVARTDESVHLIAEGDESEEVAVALSALLFSACNCAGTTEIIETCKSNAQCTGGQVCITGVCKKPVDGGNPGDGGISDGGTFDAGTRAFTGLALEPASCTLISKNGSNTKCSPRNFRRLDFIFPAILCPNTPPNSPI